jgi:neutral ceramidase
MTVLVSLRAGVGRAVLPDPRGQRLIGYARPGPSGDAYEDLEVGALYVAAAGAEAIVIALDLCYLQGEEAERLRRQVAADAGVDPSAVILAPSHTHGAPAATDEQVTRKQARAGESDPGWTQRLHRTIRSAARQAVGGARPAVLRAAHCDGPATLNRRERDDDGNVVAVGWDPNGPTDPTLAVAQFCDPEDGAPIATVVNFGCHPLCSPIDRNAADPDFVGPMRTCIRAAVGGEALFIQGASADVMPPLAFDETEREPVRFGHRVAVAALAALDAQAPLPRSGHVRELANAVPTRVVRWTLDVAAAAEGQLATSRVECTFTRPGDAQLGQRAAHFDSSIASAETGDYAAMLAERHARAVREGRAISAAQAQLVAIRLGPLAIVAAPFELFAETGRAVRRASPADVTMVAALSNEVLGYLPPAEELRAGGYEVHGAPIGYGTVGPVSPDVEGQVRRALVGLTTEVHATGVRP